MKYVIGVPFPEGYRMPVLEPGLVLGPVGRYLVIRPGLKQRQASRNYQGLVHFGLCGNHLCSNCGNKEYIFKGYLVGKP